jgi:CRP/FNR family cyclic AMP-dependent transcriptional regulator
MSKQDTKAQRITDTVVGLVSHATKREPTAVKRAPTFNPKTFLGKVGHGKTTLRTPKNHLIYSQGDAADAVFYVHAGRVKLTVLSQEGKEAIVAIFERGNFLGEGCLAGQLTRMATATALEASIIVRIDKAAMVRVLHEEAKFSELFIAYLLSRNVRSQEDLVDHLFNSAEKRLARILLLLAGYEKEGKPRPFIPKISQDTLASMVGTTRSRVSLFLNKFRKLGFIEYNGRMEVHRSLLKVVLHD